MPSPPEDSVHPEDRAAWRRWLTKHHAGSRGVWLVTWRKASGRTPLSYDESRRGSSHRTWRRPSRPGSREQFAAFPRSARHGILEWIVQARRPQSRARRVLETATLAQRGERAR